MERNKKTQQTKQKIIDAFINLLDQEPKTNISVLDITKEAQIDRGTFYRYFENKQELIDDCEDTLTDKILFIHQNLVTKMKGKEDYSDLSGYIDEALLVIDENIKMVDVFLNKTGNDSFQKKLNHFFIEQILLSVDYISDHQLSDEQKLLAANYASSAMVGTIEFWSRHRDEYNRQDVVKFLNKVNLKGLINFVK